MRNRTIRIIAHCVNDRTGEGRPQRSTSLKRHLLHKAKKVSALWLLPPLVAVGAVQAGPREQAKRMHDRLAGVPPLSYASGATTPVLDQMAGEIGAGRPLNAAFIAMEDSAFYNVTLKNFATPWTNEEQTVFAPLNDYTATVIGMVRDDQPFNTLLSADLLYIGKSGLGLPPYAVSNNAHYEAMENAGMDLKTDLVPVTQSSVTGLPASATAGVLTSRAAAQAFFIAGTNRAMFRFTLLNHLCTDLEQIKDNTRPSDRIRQDVSRSPGGDSRIFLNSCSGCHSGMDPMVQAFAFYDYDESQQSMVYTPTAVRPKYLQNSDNFKYGYVTPDDHWDNYWRHGPNRSLGWSAALTGQGSGAKSLGEELENSDAFAACQVKKVFKTVCLREPGNSADRDQISAMTASFKAGNYRLKQVFAETAVYCMGQ